MFQSVVYTLWKVQRVPELSVSVAKENAAFSRMYRLCCRREQCVPSLVREPDLAAVAVCRVGNNGRGVSPVLVFQGNGSMALSTTIVRASPTPTTEQELPQSRPRGQSPDPRSAPSPCCPPGRCQPQPRPEAADGYPQPRRPTPVDSGYTSHLNLQPPGPSGSAPPQSAGVSDKREPRQVGVFGLPPSFPAEDLRYAPHPGCNSQGPLLEPVFNAQLAQQYLGGDVPLRPYHAGAAAAGCGVCPSVPHADPSSLGALGLQHGYVSAQLHRAHLPPLDSGLLAAGKPYGPVGTLGVWSTAGLADVAGKTLNCFLVSSFAVNSICRNLATADTSQ